MALQYRQIIVAVDGSDEANGLSRKLSQLQIEMKRRYT